jgi:hypothetical protein
VNSYGLCIVRREGEDDVMDGFMHDACDNFGSLFCGLAKLGGNNLIFYLSRARCQLSINGQRRQRCQQHTTKNQKKQGTVIRKILDTLLENHDSRK